MAGPNFHYNILCEKLKELKKKIHLFKMSIGSLNSSGSIDKSKLIVDEILLKAKEFQTILAVSDHPVWLNSIIPIIENYKRHSFESAYFIELLKVIETIEAFNWDESKLFAKDGINFDELFNKYKAEGKIEEALDEILKCLKDILEYGEDNHISKKLYDDLIFLLKTVEKSKHSSKTSVESTLWLVWDFFKSVFFFVNPHLQSIENIIESVEKIGNHVINAKEELAKIDLKVQSDISSKFSKGSSNLLSGNYDSKSSILNAECQKILHQRRLDLKV